MVCQVKFTEWTRDDPLCQPVFLRIREDKEGKRGSTGKGPFDLPSVRTSKMAHIRIQVEAELEPYWRILTACH
jgi:hypothetical protein